MPNLYIKTYLSIHEIESTVWNGLSVGRPFQSHQWYVFGERVMADCQPLYTLVYDGPDPIARASFWAVRNEPIPRVSPLLRGMLAIFFKRWPLWICRSPMANASGLILPVGGQRDEVLSILTKNALMEGRRRGASFIMFDFLDEADINGWLPGFTRVIMPQPNTYMVNRWQSLEDYLAHGNKKDRQHYKRTLREAGKLGITIKKYKSVPDINAALALIQCVDRRYDNQSNPWMRSLLENMEMINGIWLEAWQNEDLVGCGALLEDNGAQSTTALGLAEDIPYVYLLLTYASLEEAFKNNVQLLRWGSGAYDVKQNLGFEKEDNASILVSSGYPLIRHLIKLFS